MKKILFWLGSVIMGLACSVYLYQNIDAYVVSPVSTTSSSAATVHRKIIPLGSYTYANLFALLPSGSRHALFYLVDGKGNPLSGKNVANAVGSKSVAVPLLQNCNPTLQNDMQTMTVQVTADTNDWINSYLDLVFLYRSKGLTTSSLSAFDASWNKVESGYQKGLTQIWRCISIPASDAYTLGLQTVAKAPITLLFFDDPFPPHTRPGTARTPMKDMLGDFIRGYGFSVP